MNVALARSARRAALAWLPVCAYTLLIWYLSSQSLDFRLIEEVPLRDKGVHFVEYGVLGFLMAHAAHVTWPARPRRYYAAVWLSLALGLIDELHQFYVPGRSADAADLLADAIGISLATLLYAGLSRWLAYRAAFKN